MSQHQKHPGKQEYPKLVFPDVVGEKENKVGDFFGSTPKIKGGVKTAFFVLNKIF